MKKLVIFTLILCLVACTDPFAGQPFITPTEIENEMTCTTLLEHRSEDFSTWIELLRYADYYNGLKDVTASITLFAPTNEAMQEFLQWQGVEKVQDLDLTYARYVVQNHILNGAKINSETFINFAVDAEPLQVQSLFNAYLKPSFGRTITEVDDADRTDEIIEEETLFINNQAAVQPRDSGGVRFTEASNAIIYYMDDVIRPLAETMVDKLEEQGEYSIFAAACRESGYDKVVEKVRDTIRIQGGGYTIQDYRFTCFAPSDEAMAAANIHSLDDLKARCREDVPQAGDSALYQYVKYHFFDQAYTKEQFCKFNSVDETLIYDTQLDGQVIICRNDTIDYSVPMLNDKAKFVRSNIEARNGYIHKMDYYLPVFEPEPVTIKWDFCNSSDIIAIVNAYGASRSLGNLFTSALTNKEEKVDLSDMHRDGDFGPVSSFTYQANTAKASYSNYRAVGFTKCKYLKASDKNNNTYGAYMNNLLNLNLGYAGWIQFKTPTIIKGKYKVTLHYASDVTMKDFHSAGSLTKFQFDPELGKSEWTKNAQVYKGLPTKNVMYCSADLVLFETIEFDSSNRHLFKAIMLDINAKTNSVYHQMWDYLLFEPIK
ncbi:MAG: DUF5108 domain-containing protein [Bacteroidales bacterium]|nr:DUF5108 domain-containing protein [Bacteroidales bacterium]